MPPQKRRPFATATKPITGRDGKLLQTIVPPALAKEASKFAAREGLTMSAWLRRLVIQEVRVVLRPRCPRCFGTSLVTAGGVAVDCPECCVA